MVRAMLNTIPGPDGPHAFAGNPLDRSEHLRGKPEKIQELLAAPDSLFLPYWQLKPLFEPGESPRLHWVDGATARPFVDQGANWVFLGIRDGRAHFAFDISILETPEREGPFAGQGTFLDALRAAGSLNHEDAGLIAQSKALIDWHSRRGFCSVCGSKTEMRQAGSSRHCTNEDCKAQHFPRTDPVVIMLAVSKGRCLLGRQPFFPPHMFSALAGFIEPGETLEEAVRREVQEEAGVIVGDVHYHSSQPWPFPSSLMIGCICDGIDDRIDVDGDELEEARWFDKELVREALEGKRSDELWVPPPFAIAHQLIRAWVKSDV